MKPILFTIGSYNVYAFGLFLALGFLLSTFIVWFFGREDLKEEEYLDAYIATCVVSLIGARLGYIATHIQEFGDTILRFILVRETPGLSLLSGICVGIVYLFFYCRGKKLSFVRLGDIYAVAISLALGLVKLGQLLGGAGMGAITQAPFAVRIVGLAGKRHPVELYEAIGYFILFVALIVLLKQTIRRKWMPGSITMVFMIGAGIIIFTLEFLKEYTIYLYGLSLRQFIVSGFTLITLVILMIRLRVIPKLVVYFKKKP